jgi:hypothetical protein
MEPKINKTINPKTPKAAKAEEREGFSTEAALVVLPPHRPQLVSGLIVVSLSMALTGHKRKYKARKSIISMNPDAP